MKLTLEEQLVNRLQNPVPEGLLLPILLTWQMLPGYLTSALLPMQMKQK